MQTDKNKHFWRAFGHATRGIVTVFQEERNMRKHSVFALLTLLAGWLFGLSLAEWVWLVLVIALVFLMEIMNTCLENVIDLITDHTFHPLGKKVKDMAAGAVLVSACLACFVGVVIFLPKIWQFVAEML